VFDDKFFATIIYFGHGNIAGLKDCFLKNDLWMSVIKPRYFG